MENEEFKLEILQKNGVLSAEQLEQARKKAEANETTVLEALYSSKIVSEDDVIQMLAAEYGMDTYNFDKAEKKVPPEVIDLLPGEIARRYKIVPVSFTNNTLRIAMSDPSDFETLDAIRYLLKMDVEGVVSSASQIQQALNFYYGKADGGIDTLLDDLSDTTMDLTQGATTDDDSPDVDGLNPKDADDANSAPVIRLVSLIILEAFRSRASDIHMEPLSKRFRVRYRIDGVLNEVDNPPKYLQRAVISRLKIMSGMDITEHRIPQDGRIQFSTMGRDLDLRVSDIPTTDGESIVMRILDKSGVMLNISELGFFPHDQEIINDIIHYPDGIFLVTGPTGSGKTTSLYAFLHSLNQPTVKIITAEDPVEYEMSGINQVQIYTEIGMTFVAALRAMLRQAPNIIMVGEIRDSETGDIAVNASLTGHLVFSTLHTNDAPSAITRLIDMGVKPFLVASSLRAVLAQRLVRRLCKQCAKPHQLTESEIKGLRLKDEYVHDTTFYDPNGCSECKKGYKGRMGIYEILILDESIQDLVYKQVDSDAIRDQAVINGMHSLREDGLEKAAAGLTSIQEVMRLTVDD